MKTDRVFVLLLVVLLPLSGCFDGSVGDADATDDSSESSTSTNNQTTIINNYYNNTSAQITTYQNGTFSYISTFDIGEYGQLSSTPPTSSWGYIDSVEAEYIEVFTVIQNQGENVDIAEFNIFARVSYIDCSDNHTGYQDILLQDCMDHDGEIIDEIIPIHPAGKWNITCDNGLSMEFQVGYVTSDLPFGGEQCEFTYKFHHDYNIEMAWWNVNYFVYDSIR
jgi:hypothetical protein